MSKVNIISGTALPLDQANVDTDQIIPKQFLTGITRKGYGINLFHDWRYLPGPEKKENPEFGFDAIIATSFADIFYGNGLNNQLLLVTLSNQEIDLLINKLSDDPKTQITLNLVEQTVVCDELNFQFDIAAHHKHNLLKGLDAIGQTLELSENIKAFEEKRHIWL